MWPFKSESSKKENIEINGGLIVDQWLKYNHNSKLKSIRKSDKLIRFSSKEIQSATDNFNRTRILGGGAGGIVFKGVLADGTEIAVKKSEMEIDSYKDVNSYVNEFATLYQVNHRNIVKLLGCCTETGIPTFVYEFVPRGNLASCLKEMMDNREFTLSWRVRFQIMIEISDALAYKAKLADFGISMSVILNQTHVTTKSKETSAYMDPEFIQSCDYSAKSDVYSFGVVMVDLLTGQIATDMINVQAGSVSTLPAHFLKSVEENQLWGIVDTRVKSEVDRSAIEAVAALAKLCLNQTGRLRPTMLQVMDELERIWGFPAAAASTSG